MSDESASTEYKIRLTPLALEMLIEVKDQREQQKLRDRIDHSKLSQKSREKHL